jgi:hypothetical protein
LTAIETPISNHRMPRKVILGFGIGIDGYLSRAFTTTIKELSK